MTRMAEFWVAVAFVAFLAIVLYYKVPAMIAKALDERADAIRKELDEARRLRQEAQDLLADYQNKHRNVGQEVDGIVEQARREAEAFALETRVSMKESLERRTKAAEDKIARAETQAVDEVRASAIDVAVVAAESFLHLRISAEGALSDRSIRDLERLL
jgi:F-type H+-transporting ATPase subunit b